MKDAKFLVKMVDAAWTDLVPETPKNVWNRRCLVLGLIMDENDGNHPVESKRGMLFRAPPEEKEITENVLNGEEADSDFLDEDEMDDY